LTASKQNKLEIVKFLLEEKSANVEAEDKKGRKIVHWTCHSDINMIKYLIGRNCVDLDDVNKKGKNTLHYASSGGQLDVAKMEILSLFSI
jgi:ankyrin repeat protein